ncbi:unnamed protein product, partial [Polarella glacialis]
IDWYCDNYSQMTGQAAMLAGFAFSYLTAEIPEGPREPPLLLEFAYFFCVCLAIGLQLGVIIISSYLSVWAPSLSLRGKRGTADLHKACDALRDYQLLVFGCFISGWVIYFFAAILQVWIFYSSQVAFIVTIPLGCFILAIVWYSVDLTRNLHLRDDEVVSGKVEHFQPYEFVADIDEGLHGNRAAGAGGSTEPYCPIHKEALSDFRPKLASAR